MSLADCDTDTVVSDASGLYEFGVEASLPTALIKVMEPIGSQKSVTRNSLTVNQKMNIHSDWWVQQRPEQLSDLSSQ